MRLKYTPILIVLFFSVWYGCDDRQANENKENNPTLIKNEIIKLANAVAESHGFLLDDTKILCDIDNELWLEKFKYIRTESPEYAKELLILDKHNYQAIYYTAEEPTLGGVLWVFVDIDNEKVITFYGEQ